MNVTNTSLVVSSLVAVALAGCGGSQANCPETTTAAAATLREPTTAPESITVTIGSLAGASSPLVASDSLWRLSAGIRSCA